MAGSEDNTKQKVQMFHAGKPALRSEEVISQKHRQRTYRVTPRHIRATIFAVAKQ
jgi:hypothetical protein